MKAALALVLDNAVATKDALLHARHRGGLLALVAVVAVAVLATAGVAMAMVSSVESSIHRGALWPHGRVLVATVTVTALVLSALFVPASSTGIAAERETGTLRLLQTTALSPGAIVMGKLLGILHGVAPLLFMLLPLLGAGALFGAVSLLDVGVATAVLVVNVVTSAAVGLSASAACERARLAGPRAASAAMLLVWGPVSLPSGALVIGWAAKGYRSGMLPVALFLLTWCVVISVLSLLFARDSLAPRSAVRRRPRAALVGALLLGGPLLAALSSAFLLPPIDEPFTSTAFLLGWGTLLFGVVVMEVAYAGAAHDGVSPWRAAWQVARQGSVGLLLAAVVAGLIANGGDVTAALVSGHSALAVFVDAAIALGLSLTGAALVTATLSTVVQRPARRVGAAVMALLALWFVPLVASWLPGLDGVVPMLDPATLVHHVSGGAASPFHTPHLYEDNPLLASRGSGITAWAALLVLLALAALRPWRERIAPRR